MSDLERRDRLGRPAVLPGSAREQVREAIRRELIAWGYVGEDPLPVRSLTTDLTGAIFRLDVVRRALDRPELVPLSPDADVAELAEVTAQAAKASAQRCIDELDELRRRMLVEGTGAVPTTLVKATPARDPRAPRPKTRAERGRQQIGYVAAEETVRLAQLLNRLTPGGYAPDHRLFLIDPPAAGAHVDPQVRR
jgi:hypothetical protein